MNLTYKILSKNLLKGNLIPGEEICIKVNQTLTQDSTGTMAYLQLNAMNVGNVKTDISVAYIDHNMLQASFENADDHEFIKTSAAKYGVIFSKPGNGICHRLHLEKFGKPGNVLIGSDSHTPTCGGLGMLSIGAGGLDVAIGMARGLYYLKAPKVYNIILKGKLKPWCSAKDIVLYVLKKLTVKGGVSYVLEYTGEGINQLSVEDRATITNMGAELGATTSIFPSDEITKDFLIRQDREKDYIELIPDKDAKYDNTLIIDLSTLTPLAAFPHSPDNVQSIYEYQNDEKKIYVNQIAVGSCTNSSYSDFMKLTNILDGKRIHENVDFIISPGSSGILKMLSENGALAKLISAGARILESSCGPCIGMGQAPKSKGISLRTFNRNFKGRCGTMDADVYLVSTETAAASALTGYLTDPRVLGKEIIVTPPKKFAQSDNYYIYPPTNNEDRNNIEIIMGPNIKPFPLGDKLKDKIEKKIILKTKDNITTDDICPSNAKLLPFRSNIPKLSEFCFNTIIPDFKERAEKNSGGIIIGGENYGQGSSREHAALLPLYLQIKVVIAKSFARIHKANLINSGIIPLEFIDIDDYEKIDEYDTLVLDNVVEFLKNGIFTIKNITKNITFEAKFNGSEREIKILEYGGYLNFSMSDEF